MVFLNIGEAYGLDVYQRDESAADQRQGRNAILNFGYDEISEGSFQIMKDMSQGTASATIDPGRGIVSAHKMKSHFCDPCIREILEAVDGAWMDEAVLYDADEMEFYPISEGTLQIGDYDLDISYQEGKYQIEIVYTGE